MPAQAHTLRIGAMTCHVVSDIEDSTLTVEKLASRYPQTDEAAVVAALQAAGESGEQSESALNCFVIQHGDTTLLMDTGMGTQAGGNVGRLGASLAAAGITPEAVDVVFITHFHPDHTLGLLDTDGKPAFPGAGYMCSETEMNFWFGDDAIAQMGADRVNAMRKAVAPLRSLFALVNDGDEVIPGVTAVSLPGHTPGHTGLLLESGGARLLHVVDLLHNIVQIAHPDWHQVFDSHPEQAVISRRGGLGRAADESLPTAFFHLPFPGIGRITRQDDAFVYTPDGR